MSAKYMDSLYRYTQTVSVYIKQFKTLVLTGPGEPFTVLRTFRNATNSDEVEYHAGIDKGTSRLSHVTNNGKTTQQIYCAKFRPVCWVDSAH